MFVDWNNVSGQFDQPVARSLNVLFYFTNLSNILVAAISLLVIVGSKLDTPRGIIAQLTALVCIIVAGSVYWLLLASEDDLTGIDVFTNFAVHTTVPLMYTLGWVFFLDHGKTTLRTIKFSILFPVGWAVFAMVRGALVDWYPYPFMDVRDLGYLTALINMAVVTLFFVALFFLAHFVDIKILSKGEKQA